MPIIGPSNVLGTNAKHGLEGSPRRDRWKRLHKDLARNFYGCDLDFVIVEKAPPGIVAFVDYKRRDEPVTFAEVITYNDLIQRAPLFLVIGNDPDSGVFEIRQYLVGDWHPEPPTVTTSHKAHCASWADYSKWESQLRHEYRVARRN